MRTSLITQGESNVCRNVVFVSCCALQIGVIIVEVLVQLELHSDASVNYSILLGIALVFQAILGFMVVLLAYMIMTCSHQMKQYPALVSSHKALLDDVNGSAQHGLARCIVVIVCIVGWNVFVTGVNNSDNSINPVLAYAESILNFASVPPLIHVYSMAIAYTNADINLVIASMLGNDLRDSSPKADDSIVSLVSNGCNFQTWYLVANKYDEFRSRFELLWNRGCLCMGNFLFLFLLWMVCIGITSVTKSMAKALLGNAILQMIGIIFASAAALLPLAWVEHRCNSCSPSGSHKASSIAALAHALICRPRNEEADRAYLIFCQHISRAKVKPRVGPLRISYAQFFSHGLKAIVLFPTFVAVMAKIFMPSEHWKWPWSPYVHS